MCPLAMNKIKRWTLGPSQEKHVPGASFFFLGLKCEAHEVYPKQENTCLHCTRETAKFLYLNRMGSWSKTKPVEIKGIKLNKSLASAVQLRRLTAQWFFTDSWPQMSCMGPNSPKWCGAAWIPTGIFINHSISWSNLGISNTLGIHNQSQ